jgi:hypothetical protein
MEPRRQAGLFALIGLKQGGPTTVGYRAFLPLRFDSFLPTLIENAMVGRDGLTGQYGFLRYAATRGWACQSPISETSQAAGDQPDGR